MQSANKKDTYWLQKGVLFPTHFVNKKSKVDLMDGDTTKAEVRLIDSVGKFLL